MSEENNGATDQGSQENNVDIKEVLGRLEQLEQRESSLKHELSTRDQKINELMKLNKEVEQQGMTKEQQLEAQMAEIKNQLLEQQRVARIAENRASAIQEFDKSGLPTDLIDFMNLDSRDEMTGQIDKMKNIVDALKANYKDEYAKSKGDKLNPSVNLNGVDASKMSLDEISKISRENPDLGAKLLAEKRKTLR